MGLFDSVYVDCPHCGKPMEFQTKAGPEPYLNKFTLEQCTLAMLMDLRDEPEWHTACGNWVVLHDPDFRPPKLRAMKVRPPDNPMSSPNVNNGKVKWWPHDRQFTTADIIGDAGCKTTDCEAGAPS